MPAKNTSKLVRTTPLFGLVALGWLGWHMGPRRYARAEEGGAAVTSAATAPVTSSATMTFGGADYRVTGPFLHANLEVFVLHHPVGDEGQYLTLDEGLASGVVAVSEKASQEVNELEIENGSDKPLFVQVGDRLVGGKQDRIVGASFVVPAHSGRLPVHSFCVEHGRWTARERGMKFACTTKTLAPQQVRAAAMSNDQGQVWDQVAQQKGRAQASLGAPNTDSSLTETLDSAEVARATADYTKALDPVLTGDPDAVGVAFCVNGKVVEVDLYPGPRLLAKLYPRLLASFAVQAAGLGKQPMSPCSCNELGHFVQDGEARSRRQEKIVGNQCDTIEYQDRVESDTVFPDGRKASCIVERAPVAAGEQELRQGCRINGRSARRGQQGSVPQQDEQQQAQPPQQSR